MNRTANVWTRRRYGAPVPAFAFFDSIPILCKLGISDIIERKTEVYDEYINDRENDKKLYGQNPLQ